MLSNLIFTMRPVETIQNTRFLSTFRRSYFHKSNKNNTFLTTAKTSVPLKAEKIFVIKLNEKKKQLQTLKKLSKCSCS